MSEDRYVVNLPFFSGFYESDLSHALDDAAERDAEYYAEKEIPWPRKEPEPFALSAEEDPNTEWKPAHLRISKDEYAEIFYDCTDYQATHEQVAKYWVEAFDWWCKEHIGTPEKSFKWESMVSPREYNFATDRVFALVPRAVIESLFENSKAEDHKTLARVIKDTFTSYDGFMSFYSNELDEWLEKPLEDWDHNELQTLVASAISRHEEWKGGKYRREEIGNLQWTLYEYTFSGNGEDDRVVDWEKFEKKVSELRAKKSEETEMKIT
jgi:hypothetical protein